MKELSLFQLILIKESMEKENLTDDLNYKNLCDRISLKESLLEDTSSPGGPVAGGMGAVVSAQPSGLAGATIGTSWSSNGGTVGSGDVSVQYNPGTGGHNLTQNVSMGRNHGARTGKKSRTKKLDIKALKSTFAKRQGNLKKFDDQEGEQKPRGRKIISFNDFMKNDFTTIKK